MSIFNLHSNVLADYRDYVRSRVVKTTAMISFKPLPAAAEVISAT